MEQSPLNIRFFYRHDTVTRHTRLNMLYDSENIIQDIAMIHVTAVGEYVFNPKSDLGSWMWRRYTLYLVCEGNFFLRFQGKDYHLIPGDLVLARPGIIPDIFCLEEGRSGRIRTLQISPGHHIRIFAENEPLATHSRFHPGNFKELLDMFRQIESAMADGVTNVTDPEETRRRVSCLTYSLFTLILKGTRTVSGGAVSRIINYMQRNIGEKITLESLENVFFIERHTITRLFRKADLQPPMTELRMIRLEYSTRLLKSSPDPISDIAFICGFSSQIVYTRCFQRAYGLTPGEYRKKYRSIRDDPQYFQEKTIGKRRKNDGQTAILEALNKDPRLTCRELAQETGLSVHGVSWNLRVLKKQKKIVRIGSSRNGLWQIVVEYRL